MRQTAAEAVPWRCHRSLIANALIVRGNRDEHTLNGRKFGPLPGLLGQELRHIVL